MKSWTFLRFRLWESTVCRLGKLGYTKPVIRISPVVPSVSRPGRYLPYLLAVLTLVVFLWAAWVHMHHPTSGMSWSYTTGMVETVTADGPGARWIRPGDVILAVDGLEPYAARGLPDRQVGETVYFKVLRDEQTFRARVRLEAPSLALILGRMSPLLVALSFWLAGVYVLAISQPGDLVHRFFLFCQMMAAILGFGSLSASGPPMASAAFGLLLWWIGPLTIHLHLAFIQETPGSRLSQVMPYLYLLSGLLSLIHLIVLRSGYPLAGQSLSYLWVGATLLASVAILVQAHFRVRAPKVHRRLGLLALAALAGFLPFILFSLLPAALLKQMVLPYSVTFMALPALPLGYGYSILRHRFVRLERYVHRSAAYALAFTAVGGLYGFIYLGLPRLLPNWDPALTFRGLVGTVILIFAAHPLYHLIQRGVNQVFYGGWYDDRTAVKQMSRALSQAEGEPDSVARTLCQALQRTMQLEYTNLLLSDGRLFSTEGPTGGATGRGPDAKLEGAAQKLELLQRRVGRDIGGARELLSAFGLTGAERRQVLGRKPEVWLFLRSGRGIVGLLVLGDKRGGEFEARDLEILEVVVRQARAALENAYLVEEVRSHSEKIKRLHRQVLQAREEERKRVARDLHDQIIQALVGLNYQLSGARARANGEASGEFQRIQAELRHILGDLRQVCADLRPPALDALGLVSMLQSRVAELQADAPFAVSIQVEGDEEQEIPEGASLCLYRVFQEGLVNIKKHAQAGSVAIHLTIRDDMVTLSIVDDGRGCTLPENLGSLSQDRHFGLIGLRELVESVGGNLTVESAPGKGCRLLALVPLVESHKPPDRYLQELEVSS